MESVKKKTFAVRGLRVPDLFMWPVQLDSSLSKWSEVLAVSGPFQIIQIIQTYIKNKTEEEKVEILLNTLIDYVKEIYLIN